MDATLKKRGLLYRCLDVRTDEGQFIVEYNGRGMGHETVSVDGTVASQPKSETWFVPRFSFWIGPKHAILTVRVWPWLAIRSMQLTVDKETIYWEGAAEQITSGDRKTRRVSGLPLGCIVMGVLIILVMIPIMMYMYWERSKLVAMQEWPSTVGRILRVETDSYEYRVSGHGDYDPGRKETRYRLQVSYDYDVNGNLYNGSSSQGGYTSLSQALAKYDVGQTVIVSYSPDDPSEAIIGIASIAGTTREITIVAIFFGSLAALFLVAGAVLMIVERRAPRRGLR